MSCLILSGWTQPIDVLAEIEPGAAMFDYSDYPSIEASFDALKKIEHTQCIAWSLGGLLALKAIMAGVLRPRHLTLIGTAHTFVSDALNGKAMDFFTFHQFRDNYARNPARTKTRFHALVAKGDRDFSRVLAALRDHPEVENTNRWLPWLEILGRESLNGADFSLVPPTLIIHGTHDAIVPHPQGEWLASKLPHAKLQLWRDTGHAPHLHDAARLREAISAHRHADRKSA